MLILDSIYVPNLNLYLHYIIGFRYVMNQLIFMASNVDIVSDPLKDVDSRRADM